MKVLQRILMFGSAAALAGLAGCTAGRKGPTAPPVVRLPVTGPTPAPAAPVPAPTAPAAAPTPAGPENPTSNLPAVPPPPPAALGEVMMLVESVPSGAIIVVDGRPVGKTPVRLAVPATPQGFFRDYLEIRARFVAAGEGMDSHTTMEEFTPRERVPAVLHFTPDGAQRTVE